MKLILACDPNGGIGLNGKLPWNKIEGDLPRFKELTSNKVILMGKNTWDSLPRKPLPNRINVVVTKSNIDGVTTISDIPLEDTMDFSDVWLIGGAKVIESSWHLINEIHLSRTFTEYTCDTHVDLLKLEREFTCWFKENHNDHSYEIWKRK
jgi:dihydrofolate reductase